MIKPDFWIRNFGTNGGIAPFNEAQINPASYDVTLGDHWIYFEEEVVKNPDWHCDGIRWDINTGEKITPFKTTGVFVQRESTSSEFILNQGQVVLATTAEEVKIPRDVCANFCLKSTVGRSFINHCLAGYIDPSFQGEITLELQNIGPNPYTLKAGMRIGQLVFMQMESEPEVAYGESGKGRYQGQKGATKPR